MIRATILAGFLAAPALAQQPPCATRSEMAASLAGKWGETPRFGGIGDGGTAVEVWGNADTGTWTITVTDSGGRSCITASGKGWAMPVAPKPGVES